MGPSSILYDGSVERGPATEPALTFETGTQDGKVQMDVVSHNSGAKDAYAVFA